MSTALKVLVDAYLSTIIPEPEWGRPSPTIEDDDVYDDDDLDDDD